MYCTILYLVNSILTPMAYCLLLLVIISYDNDINDIYCLLLIDLMLGLFQWCSVLIQRYNTIDKVPVDHL